MSDHQEAFEQRKADAAYSLARIKRLLERSQSLKQRSADLIAKSERLRMPPRQ
jgi:hypothetical protein